MKERFGRESRPSVFLVLAITALAVLAPTPGAGGPHQLTRVGEWGSGVYRELWVEGSLVFCAASDAGLDIVDLSDPANPALVGNSVLPGSGQAVMVAGSYAYVAYKRPSSQLGGIQILDISDPAAPAVVGTFEGSAGHVTSLFVAGSHAYLGYRSDGLDIVDVSDPTAPTLASGFRGVSHVRNVYVAGGYAYLAASNEKLWILDVSDPSSPQPVYQYTTPVVVYDVFVSGDHAYLANATRGLEILEVSDPEAPTFVSQYSGAGQLNNVFVSGSQAYVSASDRAVRIVDVSDPAAPSLAGEYDDSVSGSVRLFVVGTDVYFVDLTSSSLRVVDAAAPSSPVLLGTWATPGIVHDVAVAGGHAFVATRHQGLAIVDLGDPAAPELVTTHEPSSGATYPEVSQVAIQGGNAYITSYKTLEIVDVSVPGSPILLGTYTAPKTIVDLAVAAGYAYLVNYMGSLQIVDVSNPALPWKAGEYTPAPGYATAVFVSGAHAYLGCRAGWSEWTEILDVSLPWSPSEVNTMPIGRYFVAGDYAYLANNTTFAVWDVSDPASAFFVGSCPCTSCLRPHVAEGFAYLRARDPVESDYDLQVIDVSDVSAPVQSAIYPTPGGARQSTADAYRVYVADQDSGKVIIFRIDPFVAVADASVVEGHSGQTTLTLDVTLTRASDQTTTVDYATSDGTASHPTDYDSSVGTVTFPAGDTEEPVEVTIHGDTEVEPDETLLLDLSGPTGAALLDAQAVGTILNDDPDCQPLSLSHVGSGDDPVPFPASDADCPASYYRPATVVELLALADPGWRVDGWTGTDDDASVSSYNTLTMPASGHPVGVTYVAGLPDALVLRNLNIDTTRVFEACDSIWAGAFATVAPGDVAFHAGSRVTLAEGFRVEAGGAFAVEIGMPAGCEP